MPKMTSNELFYIDKNGKKQGAALHEEILKGISPEGEATLLRRSMERAIVRGVNPKDAAEVYGVEIK